MPPTGSSSDAKVRKDLQRRAARYRRQDGTDDGVRHPRSSRGDRAGRSRRHLESRRDEASPLVATEVSESPATPVVKTFLSSERSCRVRAASLRDARQMRYARRPTRRPYDRSSGRHWLSTARKGGAVGAGSALDCANSRSASRRHIRPASSRRPRPALHGQERNHWRCG